MEEKILVLDFGGQYNQLIARRVRENHVYAEIKPYNKITPQEIRQQAIGASFLPADPTVCTMNALPIMTRQF